MALTPEQQAQVDLQVATGEVATQQQTILENLRHANQQENLTTSQIFQAAAQAKQAKLEAVRLAKEVLTENARSKPVDARDVTASDIITFASALVAYVNA